MYTRTHVYLPINLKRCIVQNCFQIRITVKRKAIQKDSTESGGTLQVEQIECASRLNKSMGERHSKRSRQIVIGRALMVAVIMT